MGPMGSAVFLFFLFFEVFCFFFNFLVCVCVSLYILICIYIYIYTVYGTPAKKHKKRPQHMQKNIVNNICKIQNVVFLLCIFSFSFFFFWGGGYHIYIYIHIYMNLRGFTSFVQIGENTFRFHLYKIFGGLVWSSKRNNLATVFFFIPKILK